ncbi:MAG: hydroxyproline-2-epimerase [Pyrinomonadaceae bacterium]|nr:hydroxyproline-2-epimerase [Pyrinomonadaceae bacterium]
MPVQTIEIIDSHTAGEPTRVVLGGFPSLNGTSVAELLSDFRSNHDQLRTGILCEPRGFPAMVGALLCEPDKPDSEAGIVFFNNGGYLGMCGHGTIGVVKTLEYLGRLNSKQVKLDTVAGTVTARINDDGSVSVQNVESYRHRKDVEVEVAGEGSFRGDVAWGGNWFFLVRDYTGPIGMGHLKGLTRISGLILQALDAQGVTGADGTVIDHVELFSDSDMADSKNFVLCPGGEYDRSPCGTGTSAKLACLAADGVLPEGASWTQESVTGSVFEASYTNSGIGVVPTITGSAYITAESKLVFADDDPFVYGIR